MKFKDLTQTDKDLIIRAYEEGDRKGKTRVIDRDWETSY